ncbi:GntR family transcriptional regulator [Erysipelatoclostridium sp. An15]|uniref:GntR family transcriptional regulator n=1 Tax=Erysipelatoclostridium sp. An15 TaxID=1965566 RepID=UPI000B3982ED|nr:GntR family transcriptional regulator [Erysipelatoclostridium sp. An15]OUQ03650.1 GntR family transcriptional regulator [Erysipelatoclostridium sp. An15]
MKIIIQNSSDIPIYQQIYEQIKEAILSGKIGSGEVLPSIRQLSRDLKVSVITTTRAYTDLENDGYIMIVQGKGCFVKELNQNILEDKLMSEIEIHFAEIWKNAKILKKTDEELLDIIKILMEDLKNEQ